jgi:hypothetical protein
MTTRQHPNGKLNLDEIEHIAVLSSGGGAVTRALIRRIRELEAKMRRAGEALMKNFVGEDEYEREELTTMGNDLIEAANAGTKP